MMLEEYSFDNIYIRHAIDEAPNDEEFTMHIHEQCEIYFFVDGDVDYMVEGSRYPLDKNSLMIMRPLEVHKPKIVGKKKYERYAINFPFDFVKSIDPMSRLVRAFLDRPLGQNNLIDNHYLDTTLVNTILSQMFNSNLNEYDRQITIKTHLLLLLDMICQAFDQVEISEVKPLNLSEQIVAYVNSHVFDPITIPELAKHFSFSTSQFTRIFRQATGASPWEYITKKRLTFAKEKIHNHTLASVAAESCGFKDYSSFYRAYTKYFGEAPTTSRTDM